MEHLVCFSLFRLRSEVNMLATDQPHASFAQGRNTVGHRQGRAAILTVLAMLACNGTDTGTITRVDTSASVGAAATTSPRAGSLGSAGQVSGSGPMSLGGVPALGGAIQSSEGPSNPSSTRADSGGTLNAGGTSGTRNEAGGTYVRPTGGTSGTRDETGGTYVQPTGGTSGTRDETGGAYVQPAGGTTSTHDEMAGAAGQPSRPLEGKPCSGYTLFGMPETTNGEKSPARLIDMEGQIVHTWTIGGFPPKMLPGGSLIGCEGVIGTYDCVELRQVSWTGELEWSFSDFLNLAGGTTASRQHHDLQREADPVGYYAPEQDFVEHGTTLVLAHEPRQVDAVRSKTILDDVIYEVGWNGSLVENGFKWYGGDHIEEFGFDAAARSHIETALPNNTQLEWLHGNSISRLGRNHWYDEGHAEFHPDNIIYSSRDANFVIIIAYPAGNVVWRIGPDFAGRPEATLGQFAGQHHAHMIPSGLPGAGNILVFDNGGASGYGGKTAVSAPTRYSRSYSRVLEFNPVTFEVVWQYGAASGDQNFYSQLISSAQRLPNGNTLIDIGISGHLIEVTPDKNVVWEYSHTNPNGTAASVYRAYRIPPEWLPPGENELLGNYASWSSVFGSSH